MSKNQSVSSIIFGSVVDLTLENNHTFVEFEGKKTRRSITTFWKRMLDVLEIDPIIQLEALRILWKVAQNDVRVTKILLFKLSVVCLLLAQKLIEDEAHSVQSISLVSGISIKQITELEIQILFLLDFRLMVSQDNLNGMPRELTSNFYSNQSIDQNTVKK